MLQWPLLGIHTDLRPAFHWNLKQLFVFVVAEYESSTNVRFKTNTFFAYVDYVFSLKIIIGRWYFPSESSNYMGQNHHIKRSRFNKRVEWVREVCVDWSRTRAKVSVAFYRGFLCSFSYQLIVYFALFIYSMHCSQIRMVCISLFFISRDSFRSSAGTRLCHFVWCGITCQWRAGCTTGMPERARLRFRRNTRTRCEACDVTHLLCIIRQYL